MLMAARAASGEHQILQAELAIMDQREVVARMVAMGILQQTSEAEIIVLAVGASDNLGLIEFCGMSAECNLSICDTTSYP
jgi:hypothetical protein